MLIALAAAAPALAYLETTTTVPMFPMDEASCGYCHDRYSDFSGWPAGVHGGYKTTSSKCEECHTIHNAPEDSAVLLNANTIKATCEMCHDGTQTLGRGVYGAIAARGLTVASDHSIDATNVVPGGDAATGGSATATFNGESSYLTCSDCHSPHASNVVAAFYGERTRSNSTIFAPVAPSTHLLKQRPTGSDTTATAYGSEWCLGCHKGRRYALEDVHNHPADSGTGAYTYNNAVILASADPTTVTTMGPMGGSNRGYIMLWDSVNETRTPLQRDHYPICQQCHEDARDVGTLSADGLTGDAAAFSRPLDGVADGNPRFQNFPHESTNVRLLVETEDDLCLNCHPAAQLP